LLPTDNAFYLKKTEGIQRVETSRKPGRVPCIVWKTFLAKWTH